jgi:2-methylcitrate dehydratase PrpD
VTFTGQVSEFIVGARFDQIPEAVVQIAKEFVLDSVGVQLIGSREPVSKIVREYIKGEGGTPEAGVIGGGFRTSVTHAAFLNGTSNHAPELEACGNFAGATAVSNSCGSCFRRKAKGFWEKGFGGHDHRI